MSEYTREEILKLIEENGGPEGLDLSGKYLSGIDLSKEAVEAELKEAQEKIPGKIPVWYAEHRGGINLWRANLQEAVLVGANLQGAYLRRVNLQGAGLVGANLQGANLWFANLQEAELYNANFREAHLGHANLQGADLHYAFLERANLEGANLQGADLYYAYLQGTILHQGTKLQRANLQGANLKRSDLRGANLQGANLWGANLQGTLLVDACLQGANLTYSRLEKLDFSVTTSLALEGAYLYNAFLDDTRMKREQLGRAIGEELEGKYDEAKEAYLALKNNFAEIGRYDDAAWAYRKERRMEKLAALGEAREAWQKRDWKGAIPRYGKAVGDQVIEWVCDYGEGFWNVVRSLIAVWVIFALIYGLIGGVWGPWQDTASGKIRYVTRNPIELLSFSLRAMTTVEPIGVEARPILAMRILAPLEALLGIFLAGLLGFVAGNRIRRS
jgi:uncharacterized protein YjbI with pentapeptide repeats